MTGMKHRDFEKCLCCDRGMAHANDLTFFRIRIERFCLDTRAIQRAHGLEQLLGGHALLANVMGPDENLAVRVGDDLTLLVCQSCAINPDTAGVWALYEAASRAAEQQGEKP